MAGETGIANISKDIITQKTPEQGKEVGKVEKSLIKDQIEGKGFGNEIRRKAESNLRYFEDAVSIPKNSDKNTANESTIQNEVAKEPINSIKSTETKTEAGVWKPVTETTSSNPTAGVVKVEEVNDIKLSEAKPGAETVTSEADQRPADDKTTNDKKIEKKSEDFTQNKQERFREFDFQSAGELVENSQQLNYNTLLQNADVLYLGEAHTDYSIATHILSHVEELKRNGVKTFALELNPEDQPILDAISKGDLSQMDKLSFSFGFGSKAVEENKRELVKELVKQGIQLTAVAEWGADSSGNEQPYTAESEKKAANIIEEKAKEGKVVVLIGEKHAIYAKDDKRYRFLRSSDLLKEKGIKVKTTSFVGGMLQPGEYDRSTEGYLRRATEKKGKSEQTFYLDAAQPSFPHDLKLDGLIHIPVVPFKSAQ